MLWELSLTGIKSRMRDYIVLFSGLVMTAAIFYMFNSMAGNQEFLKSNSIISSTVFIFQLGSILLSIITFVYILYANSFLMMIRQKDYAMFMMLGAKGRKIAQLVFIETFVVGILATIIGAVLGIGLTTVVYKLLMDQLHLSVVHFSSVNIQAFLSTGIFFSSLFLLSALVNAGSIVKKPILTLLKDSTTPARKKRNVGLLFIEAVGGVIFLSVGYLMMAMVEKLTFIALDVALVTIILGTYLIFHSVLIFILQLLKRSDRFALKKLNNFTVSQLSFRVQDYTRMLSMVAMLFALALGALTVGLGFKNEIPKMTNDIAPYDVILNNGQLVEQQKVQQLQPTLNVSYQQKEDKETIYYEKEQFNAQPLQVSEWLSPQKKVLKKFDSHRLASDGNALDKLREMELPEQKAKQHVFVSMEEFNERSLPQTTLQVVQVKDFMEQRSAIQALVEQNFKNNKSINQDDASLSQKFIAYQTYNGMFSGFEFMGFFLGIAFLTMLASCLMFKILSGANSDIVRYRMLSKIGTREGLLRNSIRKEIGVLFLIPGILGVFHVLFGLKMFQSLLSDPYHQIWLPFLIFFVLYLIYYLLTVWIYTSIVLNKNNK